MAELQNSGVNLEARTTQYSKCFKSDYDERMFVFVDGNKVYKTVFSLNLPATAIKKIQYILEGELEDFIDRYFINEKNLLSKVHTPSFHIEIKTCPWWVPQEFQRLSYNGHPLHFVQTEYIFHVTLCPKVKSILGMSEKFDDSTQQNYFSDEEINLWDDTNRSVVESSYHTLSQDETDCEDASDWSHLSETDAESYKSEVSALFLNDDLPRQSDDEDVSIDSTDTPDDRANLSPRIFLVTKVEETNQGAIPKSNSDVLLVPRPINETTSQYFFSPLASSTQKVELESSDFMDNAEKLISGTSPDAKDDLDKELNRHSELFSRNVPKIVDFAHSQDTFNYAEPVSFVSNAGKSGVTIEDSSNLGNEKIVIPFSDDINFQEKKKSFGWGFIGKLFGK